MWPSRCSSLSVTPMGRCVPGSDQIQRAAFDARWIVRQKAAQAKVAMDAGHPFVLVLARTHSELEFMPHYVIGAMFGTPMISFAFTEDVEHADKARMVFGQGARLQESLNTRFSAVAVISGFNPGMARIERIAEAQFKPGMSVSHRMGVVLETARKEQEKGRFRDGEVAYRLQIFHNPYASVPLSTEFAGPYDDQWMGNRTFGIYYEATWGVRGNFVSGRHPLGG